MKKIVSILLVIGLVCCLAGTATAETTVQPRLNNTTAATLVFSIDENGLAEVVLTCYGECGTMTGVTATTYIEKKTFLFFWSRVDIGTGNDVWVDIYAGCDFIKGHTVQLTSKGTYRAVTEMVVSGSAGADDVINIDIEDDYA